DSNPFVSRQAGGDEVLRLPQVSSGRFFDARVRYAVDDKSVKVDLRYLVHSVYVAVVETLVPNAPAAHDVSCKLRTGVLTVTEVDHVKACVDSGLLGRVESRLHLPGASSDRHDRCFKLGPSQ